MILESPTLGINEEASLESIGRIIPKLKGKENPYAILRVSELEYVQTLWTEDGYEVEFQEGSIDRHFVLSEYIEVEEVVKILGLYLTGENGWKEKHDVWRKNIRGFWGNLGYQIGKLLGRA